MPFLFALFIIFFSFQAFGETVMINESPLQVWRVSDRRWTIEEEHQFGKWVEENVTEDFFIRYKIPVDCADVPYAIRWIYARIAHLPAAATTKNNKLIGHWSTRWGHLPTHKEWQKDRRFRAALLFMLNETTTRTLPLDTYPIQIDPESVTPGTAFFITESHSGIIARVVLDGSHTHPLQTWEATVPAKTQKMSEKNFLAPRPESTVYSGLVKFRWPITANGQWRYLPVWEHPFYSMEQYSSNFYEGYADFVEAVAKRIDPTDYDPWDKMEKVLETITRFLHVRIPIVSEGYKQCRKGGCPEGSARWEIHSTPGRDGMVTLLMDHLHKIIESNYFDPERVKEKMEAIRFQISKDLSVTFHHLYQNYLWLSPHPEDSIEARWGLKKCDMILSQMKNAKTSIVFIERTYRKRDPKYADFSVRHQQEILQRLQAEWNKTECIDPPPAPAKARKK
jgi:hypothetical protein